MLEYLLFDADTNHCVVHVCKLGCYMLAISAKFILYLPSLDVQASFRFKLLQGCCTITALGVPLDPR